MPVNKKLLDKIRANSEKLKGCKRHLFDGGRIPPGNKYTCMNCGGEIKGTDVLHYVAGYEAAGGEPDDVYPG